MAARLITRGFAPAAFLSLSLTWLSAGPLSAESLAGTDPLEPVGGTAAGTMLAATSKLTWQSDLDKCLEMARRHKKMVLVDVYTDWCGWCHKLDRDTYSNPEVISFVNSQFVCLKIDAEDGGKGERFAQTYRVTAFPCIMVLDASGKRVGAFYGYRTAQQFPGAIKDALAKG